MKIIHFADLHLGVETYGRVDPATGLSSRLVDFLAAYDQLVDYALESHADLVLFCGDAYKTREPTQTQQREFARRIDRLSRAGIPVFLLIGNHDMPNAVGRATATEIFHTLSVKNVYVAARPEVYRVQTAGGVIQVAALPWLRRSALLSREEARDLTIEQTRRMMEEALTQMVGKLAAGLDPALPSVLAAHVLVGDAKVGRGSERAMSIGQEPALLLGNIANPAFDYVALGHIHKHQVLHEKPPVVYAGSLERVDFGEENDDKGFYVVDIDPESREVEYHFHAVATRRFLTIDVAAGPDDTDVTATVIRSIAGQSENLRDAIVRLRIEIPEAMEGQLHAGEIREALKTAYFCTVAREIKREVRPRLTDVPAGGVTPLAALETWLDSQKTSPERRQILLEHAAKLLHGDGG